MRFLGNLGNRSKFLKTKFFTCAKFEPVIEPGVGGTIFFI